MFFTNLLVISWYPHYNFNELFGQHYSNYCIFKAFLKL